MKRFLHMLPILLILAVPTVACTVTARTLLPRIDAALASGDEAPEETAADVETTPQPEIESFDVQVDAEGIVVGDSLTATWSTSGGDVQLCLTQSAADAGATRCVDGLASEGALGIRLDSQLAGPVSVQLTVAPERPVSTSEEIDLGLVCEYEWFTEPEQPGCPATQVYVSDAAAQPYEHGWMLWINGPGRYIVLTDEPIEPGAEEKEYLSTFDPLETVNNTADSVEAPEGLFAPVSGFGMIWRGDAKGTGFRDAVGWATKPEYGYQAQYQCDDRDPASQFCYVTHPDGWLVVLHPDGYWYPAENTRDYP